MFILKKIYHNKFFRQIIQVCKSDRNLKKFVDKIYFINV